MPIFVPETVSEKGKDDAKRHREKHREAIKKNLPAIIADEAIITGKKGKIVRIPVKRLDIPYFKPAKKGKGMGIGQGPGKAGDIIGRKPGGAGPGQGQAGSEPGEDYIEAEFEIEELIELMVEDLGLPRLEEKEIKQFLVNLGYKIHGHAHVGPWVLLDRRATSREGIKRFWALLRQLERDTGKDELVCFDALRIAKGIMAEALAILSDPQFQPSAAEIKPFPIFASLDDLRFHKIKPDVHEQSRAVIFAMMDVSGSMGTMKKYLARSMLFWLVAILRKIYKEVEIRFIIHHTTARIVDEESFFKTTESGGTYCYTAYEIANQLIDTEYPTNQWNVYVWHFSDGEDFDPKQTVSEVRKLFAKNINMFGYGEVKPAPEYNINIWSEGSDLWRVFKDAFDVRDTTDNGLKMLSGKKEPIFGVVIAEREHILPALKQFLAKDRWVDEGMGK